MGYPRKPKTKPRPKDFVSKSYEVGYGKPPQGRWFKPGHSGNPAGRPRGALNKPLSPQRLKDIILKAAYRPVDLSEGQNKTVTVPLVTAVMRKVTEVALAGNLRAAQWLIAAVQDIELEDAALQDEYFREAMAYKAETEAMLKLYRCLGLTPPEVFPHPDDIILDYINMRIIIKGPVAKEDVAEWERLREQWRAERKICAAAVTDHEAQLANDPMDPCNEIIRIELDYERKVLARLDQLLSD
jgi:hypothetical protein